MTTHPSTAARMTLQQRLASVLCVAVIAILVVPFLDDVAHGHRGWVAGVPFFLIGLSAAMGLVAAGQDPARTTTLDAVRRRTFWVGVALLPVGIYLGSYVS